MSWKRVRGHDALVRAFQRVIQRGRLAHAYLFTGPPGVGKRLFATELAKALLCESPGRAELDACDVCPACLQVEAQTHPDFFPVRRPEEKHEFPIELMRELCQHFSMKSARGRGKVILIDDADDLNEESANCFLKTLEEPPPRSVLILIGSSAERQLPTIVSRCQVVNFGRLPEAEVATLLRAAGVAEALLGRLLRVSEGSPGVARDLSDPALWDFRKALIQGLTALPVDSMELGKTWMQFVEEAGKESAAQRQRASVCVGLLLAFLQDALRLKVGVEPPADSDSLERKALDQLSQRLDEDQLIGLMERCLDGEFHIDRRVQLLLSLEALTDALGQRLAVKR